MNLLRASTFNIERLDILRDSIRHLRKSGVLEYIIMKFFLRGSNHFGIKTKPEPKDMVEFNMELENQGPHSWRTLYIFAVIDFEENYFDGWYGLLNWNLLNESYYKIKN